MGTYVKSDVLAANAAFYAAYRDSDYDRMRGLWSRRDNIACQMPGRALGSGRDRVMKSWRRTLRPETAHQVRALEQTVVLNGSVAMVVCVESLDESRVVATNIFRLEDGDWRMVHRQATLMS